MVQVRGSKSRALHDRVLVNCQYSMAVFSTAERKRRPRGDRRSVEMTRHLERTFAAAILTHLYPRSQIDIFVEVRVIQYWLAMLFSSTLVCYVSVALLNRGF